MPLERRPVLLAFVLILIGFLLAVIVVEALPIPEPPACYSAICNAADIVDLVGLFMMVIGLVFLGRALMKPAAEETAAPSTSPQYSFTGDALPPASSTPPLAAPALPPAAPRKCPACGASITGEYGFCPRCGQSLSR